MKRADRKRAPRFTRARDPVALPIRAYDLRRKRDTINHSGPARNSVTYGNCAKASKYGRVNGRLAVSALRIARAVTGPCHSLCAFRDREAAPRAAEGTRNVGQRFRRNQPVSRKDSY